MMEESIDESMDNVSTGKYLNPTVTDEGVVKDAMGKWKSDQEGLDHLQ